jgi:hypothetical protein
MRKGDGTCPPSDIDSGVVRGPAARRPPLLGSDGRPWDVEAALVALALAVKVLDGGTAKPRQRALVERLIDNDGFIRRLNDDRPVDDRRSVLSLYAAAWRALSETPEAEAAVRFHAARWPPSASDILGTVEAVFGPRYALASTHKERRGLPELVSVGLSDGGLRDRSDPPDRDEAMADLTRMAGAWAAMGAAGGILGPDRALPYGADPAFYAYLAGHPLPYHARVAWRSPDVRYYLVQLRHTHIVDDHYHVADILDVHRRQASRAQRLELLESDGPWRIHRVDTMVIYMGGRARPRVTTGLVLSAIARSLDSPRGPFFTEVSTSDPTSTSNADIRRMLGNDAGPLPRDDAVPALTALLEALSYPADDPTMVGRLPPGARAGLDRVRRAMRPAAVSDVPLAVRMVLNTQLFGWQRGMDEMSVGWTDERTLVDAASTFWGAVQAARAAPLFGGPTHRDATLFERSLAAAIENAPPALLLDPSVLPDEVAARAAAALWSRIGAGEAILAPDARDLLLRLARLMEVPVTDDVAADAGLLCQALARPVVRRAIDERVSRVASLFPTTTTTAITMMTGSARRRPMTRTVWEAACRGVPPQDTDATKVAAHIERAGRDTASALGAVRNADAVCALGAAYMVHGDPVL